MTSTCSIEDVIKQNSNLIYMVASKYINYPDKEDLHQVGAIGLINAYKNYNPNMNTKFSTYAFPYIVGEINKYVRENKNIKISKDMLRLGRKINEYILKHKKVRGYEPSICDIAKMLDTKESTVITALNAIKSVKSLDETINTEGKEITLLDITSNKETVSNEDIIDLKYAFNCLTEEEKELIIDRYYMDLTQQEVAIKLNMNQVSVSRLERKVLDKLRQMIK